MTDLAWLPEWKDWRAQVKSFSSKPILWGDIFGLVRHRLDFVQCNAVDALARERAAQDSGLADFPGPVVKLALLGSCTVAHLHAAIRVAGLRHGIWLEIVEADYGQYWQALSEAASPLHAFKPDVVLLSLDAHHVAQGLVPGGQAAAEAEQVLERLRACWRLAKEHWGAAVIQQTVLPLHPQLLGHNEHRASDSKSHLVAVLNAALRPAADAQVVDLLALDDWASRLGLAAWHDTGMWFRAKQEIRLTAAPLYGELLARLVAARLGRSAKCLVLDLDNTLWGGAVGDVGLQGLVLGQGSALGEAYVAVQHYAKALAARGVVLAVCSKNDVANAQEPFLKHPDMVLRLDDIACFVANWEDKASNLRRIAAELNLGLDSLVFLDDNPFERDWVRRELPMVAVPEASDDPVQALDVLSAAGYFESVALTAEDRHRSAQYQQNRQRAEVMAQAGDLEAYLRGLEMRLLWGPVSELNLSRVAQLVNKTNQFNLTTRRRSEDELRQLMADPACLCLQFRLRDRLGDSGLIAVVLGQLNALRELELDTWLMSCRVLGRGVERATLQAVLDAARQLGAEAIVGHYLPSPKNAMVADHYEKLGFTRLETSDGPAKSYCLPLSESASAGEFLPVLERET